MKKHTCDHCSETFTSLSDKMIHLTIGHDRLRRFVTCWRCTTPIDADHTHCAHCGWERSEIHRRGAQDVAS